MSLTLHGRIYKVMTLETWLKIHTNDCKLWQPPQKPYKLLIFFTISVIFMGKHSDFRISSFQVVYAWRILQFNWKNEIYLKGFIWFFPLQKKVKTNHAKTRLKDLSKRFRDFEILPKFSETHVFRGTIRHPFMGIARDNLGGFVYWSTSLINCCLWLRITTCEMDCNSSKVGSTLHIARF